MTDHRPLITDHRSLTASVTGHWPSLLSLLILILGTGCNALKSAGDFPAKTAAAITPGKKEKPTRDPLELQLGLFQFADEFAAHMIIQVEALRRGTNVLDREETLRWKIALTSEPSTIVSGPNAMVNVLDMTVFITSMRIALERTGVPRVYGASAQPMLATCRAAEADIWRIADKVLEPEQRAALHGAIEDWCQQHPSLENVLGTRTLGLAFQVVQAHQADTTKSTSALSLFQVDPLAGLDPAVREITKTRLFAERALYVTQKLPELLRWQTELLSSRAADLPAVQQLITNSTRISDSMDRFSRAAEQLPAQVSAEREEILKTLQAQEQQLTPLLNEVRQTLTAGTGMSTSLNTTLTTFDALMKRFGVGETNRPPSPDKKAEPFRIQDYGQTAERLEAAARQLTELLQAFDQTLGSTNLAQLSMQVGPAVQQAQTRGKAIVDYAFWRGVLLVAIVWLAALNYRLVVRRHLLMVVPQARAKGGFCLSDAGRYPPRVRGDPELHLSLRGVRFDLPDSQLRGLPARDGPSPCLYLGKTVPSASAVEEVPATLDPQISRSRHGAG
jgi:hypothetical protein